jgi:glutamyl-tRNA reductase
VVRTVTAWRRRLDEIREAELREALRKLDHLSPEDAERIAHLTRALLNKFLHDPTRRLRSAAGNGTARDLAEAVEYLFDLEQSTPDAEKDAE